MTEQARIKNRINRITPQPHPVHDAPLPKPNRSCNRLKSQFKKASLSKPDRQPGLSFISTSL